MIMKKVLVTGSEGFIGGYIVKELLTQGYMVYGIDNLSKYGEIIRNHSENENYKFFDSDVKNKSFLTDAFEKYHNQIVELFNKKRKIQYQEGNVEFVKEGGNVSVEFDFKKVSIENKQVSINRFEIVKNIY